MDLPRGRRPIPVRVLGLLPLFGWAVALVLFLAFTSAFELVLLGVVASSAVAALLAPISRRLPGPRAFRGPLAAVLFFALLGGAMAVLAHQLWSPLRRQLRHLERLGARVDEALAALSEWMGLPDPVTLDEAGDAILRLLTGGTVGQAVGSTVQALFGLGLGVVLVTFGSLYLLGQDPDRLVEPGVRLLPPHRRAQARDFVRGVEPRLRWWLLGTLASMTIVFLAAWGAFTLVGIDLALPLALLWGLAEIVPNLGPAFGGLVGLVLAIPQGGDQVFWTAVAWLAIQTLEGYVILPLVMRGAVHVPPVVSLFTVVFWGRIFGLPGVFLAIPLDLVIWTAIERFVLGRGEGGEGAGDVPSPPSPRSAPSPEPRRSE
ncbi:AI-2E family transporter [Myxococcota bacterium]|nr:AI-2E family transporter [Myxococcota bacterium]